MIFVILILSVLLFAYAMIFVDKKQVRWCLVISGFIFICLSETGIILNDRIYFGMEEVMKTKQEQVYGEKNRPVLLYEEEKGVTKYYYWSSSGAKKTVTTSNDPIKVEMTGTIPTLKVVEKQLRYKNKFYEALFFLENPNGKVLQRESKFELPPNWQVVELENQ